MIWGFFCSFLIQSWFRFFTMYNLLQINTSQETNKACVCVCFPMCVCLHLCVYVWENLKYCSWICQSLRELSEVPLQCFISDSCCSQEQHQRKPVCFFIAPVDLCGNCAGVRVWLHHRRMLCLSPKVWTKGKCACFAAALSDGSVWCRFPVSLSQKIKHWKCFFFLFF